MIHKKKRTITIIYSIKHEGPFQVTDTEKASIVQFDMALHKRFTGMCSKGKHMTGTKVIEKAMFFMTKYQ